MIGKLLEMNGFGFRIADFRIPLDFFSFAYYNKDTQMPAEICIRARPVCAGGIGTKERTKERTKGTNDVQTDL